MQNKYLRFFFVEKPGRRWVFVLFLLGFAIACLVGILVWQKGEISIMLKRRIFIERAAKMEQLLIERKPILQLASFQVPEKTIVEIPQKEIIEVPAQEIVEAAEEEIIQLQGIVLQDGKPSALINGEIYDKGHAFGEFRVVDITDTKTVLRNHQTGRVITLFLPEFEWISP